jgi:hypothetical protein
MPSRVSRSIWRSSNDTARVVAQVRLLLVPVPEGATVVLYGSALRSAIVCRDVDIWVGGGPDVEREVSARLESVQRLDLALDSDLDGSPGLQAALRLAASGGRLLVGHGLPAAPSGLSPADAARAFRLSHARSACALSFDAMVEARRGNPSGEILLAAVREFLRSQPDRDWRAVSRASRRALLREIRRVDPDFARLARRRGWDSGAAASRLHSDCSQQLARDHGELEGPARLAGPHGCS